jgi:hypothetical protein
MRVVVLIKLRKPAALALGRGPFGGGRVRTSLTSVFGDKIIRVEPLLYV